MEFGRFTHAAIVTAFFVGVLLMPAAAGTALSPRAMPGERALSAPAGKGAHAETRSATIQDPALPLQPSIVVDPPALEATLPPDETTVQTLWLTNTGDSDLDFVLHEFSRTLSLPPVVPGAAVRIRARSAPVVASEVWDQVQTGGRVEVIIYLRELADLSPAYAIGDWEARGRFVYERLQATAARSGGALRALLATAGAEPRVLLAANALAATVDVTLLERVVTRPEVARVGPNRVYAVEPLTPAEGVAAVEVVEWNIAQIRADEVWDTWGITGQGITVGNVGTGVLYTHSALVEQYRGNQGGGTFDHNYHWFDFINGQATPYDDNGHSTFVVGVVAGDDGGTNQIGVAPGAKWFAAKAIDAGGGGSLVALHQAMAWMLAPTDLGGGNADPAQRPHVGFGAWGGMGCNIEFLPDLTAWQAAGILPVFTAGIGGPGCGTMESPADLPEAFTAGGTDESDVPTYWSSRGPSCWGGIKPEVAAPGVNIRSSYNDGNYTIWGGTSAGAAAHLAGTAALVLSADPALDPLDARPVITGTALCLEDLSCGGTSCPGGPNNVTGWGRIDAFEAVSLTVGGIEYDIPWLSESPVSGTVSANANVPIAVTFDATGLAPGTYLGLLDVESNDPAMPHVGVPVTLTVALPPPCDPVAILTITAEVSGCVASLSAALTGTAPYTYAWNFGAFAPSTAPTPTVDFALSGTYPYTLTVLNCSSVYSDTEPGQVTVACPAPDVWFYVYLPVVLREH